MYRPPRSALKNLIGFASLTLTGLALLLFFGLMPNLKSPEPSLENPGIQNERNECTTAIISGSVTVDGRPILWKNRDILNSNQEFAFFDDGEYEYVTVITADQGAFAWGGVNEAGFAIENSNSHNLPDSINTPEDDGVLMKLALQTCLRLEDFEVILDSTNETGRATPANYGAIDAWGGAALYEAGNYEYTKFDVTDTTDAPRGYLVRSNFSVTGDDENIIGQWRHDRVVSLIDSAIADGHLSCEYLYRKVITDMTLDNLYPYPLPFEDVYDSLSLPQG